ncbi:MAG: glycosyltransferase [Ignavibacteriaceae bacterium]|nr:glycosyltransferase [Ignavibacteriaceae bacterium]
MTQGIAAAVVLFNPEPKVIENIYSYLEQVDVVYMIDNSNYINDEIVNKMKVLDKIRYTWNGSNLGIAAALNTAAEQAIHDGFNFLLTMDQDSKASIDLISKLYPIIISSDDIGIVAAEHFDPEVHEVSERKETKEILFTMTSGNLLSLSAFKIVGSFLNELFIDHVDHEFCLRLRKHGYRIIKTNETYIYHKLGQAVKKRIFKLKFCPSNHPPIRLYYRTRNRFYVDKLYRSLFPDYLKIDRKNLIRELIEIYLFEKDLWQKSKMILRGYIHYKKNILGKYNYTK